MSAFKLLTETNKNPKTAKGNERGYLTFVLHLAPASLSGFNVCPMATQGCMAACLNTAGRGGIAKSGMLTHESIAAGARNPIQTARIRRTRLFFEDRDSFMALLSLDAERAIKVAAKHGLTPVFRLNGTSDIRWETVPVYARRETYGTLATVRLPNIMAAFPGVQFYDYTKIANRRGIPGNYKLTFSLADGNDAVAWSAWQSGMSVAAVFRDKETVSRYVASGFIFGAPLAASETIVPVVNGDETDLRFLDPAGSIVALYAKGNAKRDTSGFVRD